MIYTSPKILLVSYGNEGRMKNNKEKAAHSLLLVHTEVSQLAGSPRREGEPTRCLHKTVVTVNEEKAWSEFRHLPPSLTFTFKRDSSPTRHEIDNCQKKCCEYSISHSFWLPFQKC
jgi:hypothetical protein